MPTNETNTGESAASADAEFVALCDRLVGELPISGGSVCAVGEKEAQSTLWASDTIASQLDELQFDLGEGPRWDATRSGALIVVNDLPKEATTRWPVLAGALVHRSIGAVFVFPLTLGAISVGVVELYRETPGSLGADSVAKAARMARTITIPAVTYATRSALEDHGLSTEFAPELRREVHQAAGMISYQLGITATEAFMRLRAHAFAIDVPVHVIANDVVCRRLNFKHLLDDHP
ncbi:MAG TPA: GAF and ANTAR domain-containing protein [Glaciihabitans sp.]|jgi:hypothetical protein|nr:GAF and ANTAR domain-containing protein [Glaciihabitans sp.]